VKPDPEGKSIMHHILLNAADLNLQLLTDSYGDFLSFNSITLDTNECTFLALTLGGFHTFKERSHSCLSLILDHYQRRDYEGYQAVLQTQDRLGRTMIQVAISHGMGELVKELIERGVKLETTDFEDRDSWAVAIEEQ
jgi:ankyrin repeat protein